MSFSKAVTFTVTAYCVFREAFLQISISTSIVLRAAQVDAKEIDIGVREDNFVAEGVPLSIYKSI